MKHQSLLIIPQMYVVTTKIISQMLEMLMASVQTSYTDIINTSYS